jgi:hypothetical protein
MEVWWELRVVCAAAVVSQYHNSIVRRIAVEMKMLLFVDLLLLLLPLQATVVADDFQSQHNVNTICGRGQGVGGGSSQLLWWCKQCDDDGLTGV